MFGGETSDGDFVVQTLVSAQNDLVLWDESATAVVTISSTTGDDSFASKTNTTGKVLFLRQTAGKTTTDLFVWDQTDLTTVQLTTTTQNHTVPAVFAATHQ